jgi:hypothetical protein
MPSAEIFHFVSENNGEGSKQEREILEDAKHFFEERADAAANSDDHTTFLLNREYFGSFMHAAVENLEDGRFFAPTHFIAPVEDKSPYEYLQSVLRKSEGMAASLRSKGERKLAKQYEERTARVRKILEVMEKTSSR